MLLIPHENKPSMIAKVATVIGESNININRMNVAQKSKPLSKKSDNISIMIINTDNSVDKTTLDKITEIEGVQSAKYISITA